MVVQQKCFARSPRPGVAPYKVQKALKNKKKPTGDPDCTVEVRRAKHIVHAIQGKIGVEDYESEEEVEDEGLYDFLKLKRLAMKLNSKNSFKTRMVLSQKSYITFSSAAKTRKTIDGLLETSVWKSVEG
jgi:hypothetical protein